MADSEVFDLEGFKNRGLGSRDWGLGFGDYG